MPIRRAPSGYCALTVRIFVHESTFLKVAVNPKPISTRRRYDGYVKLDVHFRDEHRVRNRMHDHSV